jgi:hypothetical protein
MPENPSTPLRVTLIALLPALCLKLGLHLAALSQYGYFRDELYYVASTGHLGFGYVEHPPLFIWLLAVWTGIFGESVGAIRIFSVLAGTAHVAVVGLMVRSIGGRAFAQAFAALATALTPVFLGSQHFYSMNVFDQFFWATAGLVLIPLFRTGKSEYWLRLGLVLGLGLLNKISVLFLGAGIIVAFLLSPSRRALLTRWPWFAGGISLLLFLPFLIWQAVHGFPLLEFIRNATSIKMVNPGPIAFLRAQVLNMNPLAAPVFLAGLVGVFLVKDLRQYAFMPVIFLTVVAILLGSGSNKAYYLAAAYPFLLVPGVVVVERLCARSFARIAGWAYAGIVVVGGLLATPLAIPILPPEAFVDYQRRLGVAQQPEERSTLGPLPQHLADMFGWEEFVAEIAKAYNALPPSERAKCAIFVRNYGEAGAIDVLGRKYGLPHAISGHNTYWYWGTGSYNGEVLIMVGGNLDEEARTFESVERVGTTPDSKYSMPYERNRPIYLCKKLKIPLREAWGRSREII